MKHHKARLLVVSSFFLLILAALIWRMQDLTVRSRQFLQGQGNARSLRVIEIPANRGMITDRQGAPLAVSTPLKSVWINPKEFSPDKEQFHSLAQFLNITPKQLAKHLSEVKGREFIYLQRQCLLSKSRN